MPSQEDTLLENCDKVKPEQKKRTLVYVTIEGKILTLLENCDKVKPEKQQTLAYIILREVKVRKFFFRKISDSGPWVTTRGLDGVLQDAARTPPDERMATDIWRSSVKF